MKQDLIERYIQAVGNILTSKQREDVLMELRSSLQDALEERGLEANKAEDQAGVRALLKEFGRPEKIALSYGGHNYLIGPATMPFYYRVLRITATIITVVHGIGFAAALTVAGQDLMAPGAVLSNYFDSLFRAFAIITLVFALIERQAINIKLDDEWDPESLPQVQPDEQRVNVFEKGTELFFLVGFLSLVYFFPDWSPTAALGPELDIVPAIMAVLLANKVWLTIIWVGELVVGLTAIGRGRWNNALRIADVGLAYAGAALIGQMTVQLARVAKPVGLEQVVLLSFGVTFLIVLVDASVRFYKLLKARRVGK